MGLFILLTLYSGLGLALLGILSFLAGSILLFAGRLRGRGWAASLALCALLLGGGVWQANGFFGLGLGVPRDFTAENWAKTAPDQRHFLVNDLLETQPLVGMTADEVRGLLGAPDYTDSPELLAYVIDMPFDESTLDIYLQNGRVTGVDRTREH